MKYENEVKELLIHNAIHLIAKGGFEKATVKELTTCGGNLPGFKMNDVYIYRIFGSKENLYEAAFARLDSELFYNFRRAFKIANEISRRNSMDLKSSITKFLELAFDFLMNDEERCRCYVRFYYSIYFTGDVAEAHKELFSGIISEIAVAFKEEADVVSIIHSVFSAMFDFAIRAYNGYIVLNDVEKPHIYNVLYCMMSSYLKDDLQTSQEQNQ